MNWILEHWEWVLLGVLTVDKVVALTPTKHDDLIWSSIRASLAVIFPALKKKT